MKALLYSRVLVCLTIVLSVLALIGGAWGASSEVLPSNPVAGIDIFIEKGCVFCHAIRGEGGKVGPDLGLVELNHSLLEVAGIMWSHSPQMSEKLEELNAIRPTLKPEEMGDLIAFLYFLNYFGQPGDPKVGSALFEEKGCSRCHQLGGHGGQVGPPLDRYKQYVSPIFIARALWNHGPKMASLMKKLGVKRQKLVGEDLNHILAHIKATSSVEVERKYLEPGNPLRGEALFTEKRCLECHSIKGQGGKVGPDLGRLPELRGSLTHIAGTMWNHGPAMWEAMKKRNMTPVNLSAEEMNNLVTYLYFLQYIDEPGDAKVGRALFSEKGCVQCHGLRADQEGKVLLRGDEKRETLSSPIAVVTAMWNHAPNMAMVAEERRVNWPRFEGHEMADLLAYILSGKDQSARGP